MKSAAEQDTIAAAAKGKYLRLPEQHRNLIGHSKLAQEDMLVDTPVSVVALKVAQDSRSDVRVFNSDPKAGDVAKDRNEMVEGNS